jgi:hypothetical protein
VLVSHFPCVIPIFSYSVLVIEDLSAIEFASVAPNVANTAERRPHFPTFDLKVEVRDLAGLPGGQVASQMLATAQTGARASSAFTWSQPINASWAAR